jgi:DNA repair protein RecO (recombination protein O)
MARPRTYQTQGVIIKKTRLGEADRILSIYTRDLGKIQGVARGVRRSKSKMAGHLELLTYSQLTLARGRTLDIITGAQTIESFLPLKTDLMLTSYGLYATELVSQFTGEEQPDEVLFDLLLETLRAISSDQNLDLVLRYFEVKLLDAAGYRPQLHECVACHQPLAPVVNSFCASTGGMLCPFCAPKQPFSLELSVNAVKVLRFTQDNPLDAVQRLRIDSPLARELEAVTRHYLRYILEREVRSAAWLDTLREQLGRMPQPEEAEPVVRE